MDKEGGGGPDHDQPVDDVARGKVFERNSWMRMALGGCQRMGNHRGHKGENGVPRRDPGQRSLHEGWISSTLCERTGVEKFDGGDLARGGFSLALSGLLGLRCSALGGGLRGGFYLGR